jgi:hypothetical protein
LQHHIWHTRLVLPHRCLRAWTIQLLLVRLLLQLRKILRLLLLLRCLSPVSGSS